MKILVLLWSLPDGTLVNTMAREVVPHPCRSCDNDHHDDNDNNDDDDNDDHDDDDEDNCWEKNTVIVFRSINVHTVLPLVGKIIMMVGKIMMVVKIIRCHR